MCAAEKLFHIASIRRLKSVSTEIPTLEHQRTSYAVVAVMLASELTLDANPQDIHLIIKGAYLKILQTPKLPHLPATLTLKPKSKPLFRPWAATLLWNHLCKRSRNSAATGHGESYDLLRHPGLGSVTRLRVFLQCLKALPEARVVISMGLAREISRLWSFHRSM